MGNKEKSKWLGLELNQGQFKIKRGRFHRTVTVGQSGSKFYQDYSLNILSGWVWSKLNSDGQYFYLLTIIVSISWSLTMGVTRAQSVFLPIWQDEFQSDYKSVSSLYSFGFGGSMLNCLLG